jgi:hypothetical protein
MPASVASSAHGDGGGSADKKQELAAVYKDAGLRECEAGALRCLLSDVNIV